MLVLVHTRNSFFCEVKSDLGTTSFKTAARNFKEAARIATKTNSLCVEKESILIDMDTTTLNLKLLREKHGLVNH